MISGAALNQTRECGVSRYLTHWSRLTLLLAAGSSTPIPSVAHDGVIQNPEKLGIGTGAWGEVRPGQIAADAERVGAAWYYTWQPGPPGVQVDEKFSEVEFVPMIWGEAQVSPRKAATVPREAKALLGFNEPDHHKQSNLTVDKAIQLWPRLEQLGLRLGSPCNSSGSPSPAYSFIEKDGWVRRFMKAVEEESLRVDFMALHYYTNDPDIDEMRRRLVQAHDLYGRPLWITEWALVDWENHDRFTLAETAEFLREAAHMMDNLPFVERHAWFAMYRGGDGLFINTELLDLRGRLTPVGEEFRRLSTGVLFNKVVAEE